MTSPRFRMADPVADRQALLDINIEYVSWVFAEIEKSFGFPARHILGMEVADYDIPPQDGARMAWLYQHGGVVERSDSESVVHMKVRLLPADRGRFERQE